MRLKPIIAPWGGGNISRDSLTSESGLDSLSIYYRINSSSIDLKRHCCTLEAARTIIDKADSLKLIEVRISGYASPEGSEIGNDTISVRRARAVKLQLLKITQAPDSLFKIFSSTNHWADLYSVLEKRPVLPERENILPIVASIASSERGSKAYYEFLNRYEQLIQTPELRYIINKEIYPELRSCCIDFVKMSPRPFDHLPSVKTTIKDTLVTPKVLSIPSQPRTDSVKPDRKCFIMGLRTNMLYDLALTPNIGVDFYLGSNLSLSAIWAYSWWKSDAAHFYWRNYGGDISLRYWFGADATPLTGHHIGIYAQTTTFDFEFGGKGYMGGKPGGTLMNDFNWSAGVEYGYSLSLTNSLNLDFSIAAGYIDYTYHTYSPEDECYVRLATNRLRTIFPTKAEISLVWILGNKGGMR